MKVKTKEIKSRYKLVKFAVGMELGHGIHEYIALKRKGYYLSSWLNKNGGYIDMNNEYIGGDRVMTIKK